MLEQLLNALRDQLKAKNYLYVIEQTEQINATFGDNFVAISLRAKAYLELGLYQKAVDDVNFLFQKNITNTELYEIRAEANLELEKLEASIDDAIYLLELDRFNYVGLKVCAADFFINGHYEEVVSRCDEILDDHEEDEFALFYRGMAYFHLNELESAWEDLDAALRIDRSNFKAWVTKFFIREIKQEYKQAILDTDEVRKLFPNDSLASTVMGKSLKYLGYHIQADKFLTKSLTINPHDEHALLALAELAYQYRKFKEAIEYTSTMVAASQTKKIDIKLLYSAYLLRANVHLTLGNKELALEDAKIACKLTLNCQAAFGFVSNIYQSTLQISQGIEFCTEQLERFPNASFVLLFRGGFYKQLGQYKESLQDFNLGLSLNPNLIFAYLARAQLYLAMKEYENAQRDVDILSFNREKFEKTNPDVFSAISVLQAELDKIDTKAVKVYAKRKMVVAKKIKQQSLAFIHKENSAYQSQCLFSKTKKRVKVNESIQVKTIISAKKAKRG